MYHDLTDVGCAVAWEKWYHLGFKRDILFSGEDDVLRTGAIHGLANHTVLIARDATERAIADSAAPIRDDTGDNTGVVLVFRLLHRAGEGAGGWSGVLSHRRRPN